MKVNCEHHREPEGCAIGLGANEACMKDCPARVPIVPDTPGCFPTIPPKLKPPPPLPIQRIPKGYKPGSEAPCCDPPPRP